MAGATEPEEHELMARDFEPGKGFEISQRFLEAAGIHFRSTSATLALEVMVVMAGIATDESHDLVRAQDAFRPPFVDEALQIAINGGQARSPLRHALPDFLHREGPVGILQHVQDSLPLGRLPHARGAQGRRG